MSNAIETVLAFDYGARRIGVAVGQTLSKTAQPVTVVKQKNGHIDWPSISKIIAEWQPNRILVGYPETADGTIGRLHQQIARFSAELKERYSLPIVHCDEHLSSFEAKQSPLTEKYGLDALAAQVILETWLNLKRD